MTAKPSTKVLPTPVLSPGWTAFFEFLLEGEEARQKISVGAQEQEAAREAKNERSCK